MMGAREKKKKKKAHPFPFFFLKPSNTACGVTACCSTEKPFHCTTFSLSLSLVFHWWMSTMTKYSVSQSTVVSDLGHGVTVAWDDMFAIFIILAVHAKDDSFFRFFFSPQVWGELIGTTTWSARCRSISFPFLFLFLRCRFVCRFK